jgi:hypothetical protein
VPEKLAAALDMTAELPRLNPSAGDAARTAPHPVVPAPQPRVPFADETMELPIFRELESAWFRTRKPAAEEARTATAPREASAVAGATEQLVTVDAPRTDTAVSTASVSTAASSPVKTDSPSDGAGSEPAVVASTAVAAVDNGNGAARRSDRPHGWQTAADDGWRAASAAADTPAAETTNAGLPKRVPMAQLVPGGVDKPPTSVQRRTPESVRGLLSAYHRGVQRGRTQPQDDHSTNPEATPNGQQSSQAGKEHEA